MQKVQRDNSSLPFLRSPDADGYKAWIAFCALQPVL